MENIYIYEKNIFNENEHCLTHRKSSEINNDDNENNHDNNSENENIKINKQKKINICNCDNEDTLHICCGIVSSAIFFSFFKIF